MKSKPIIGIPCDRRIYTGQPFHMAGEKYLTAIVQAANAIPLLIPVLEDEIDFDVLLGHHLELEPRDGERNLDQSATRILRALPDVRFAHATHEPEQLQQFDRLSTVIERPLVLYQ